MPTYLLTNESISANLWKMLETNPAYSQDLTTKAKVGKSAVCTYFRFIPATENTTSGDFPDISQAKTGWRTSDPLDGKISAGTWTFKVAIYNDTKYGFSIKVAVRISKSYSANGTNATLIQVSESPNVLALPASAGAIVTDSWTWSGSEITFSNEFLFVEFRLHIEVAGTSTTCQCSFICDENPATREESVTTPTFTPRIPISFTEYIVANDFPTPYLSKPAKAEELVSKVEATQVVHVAKNYPEVMRKDGKSSTLVSKFIPLRVKRIFTFNKFSDATEIFHLEISELPNVRLSAGGIKLKHAGTYTNVTPYQSKPASATGSHTGWCFPYYTGLVFHIGTSTDSYLAQLDNNGFILFRCTAGTVVVPILDNYSYSTNGSVGTDSITLTSMQYVVFYKTAQPPSLGTYLTTSIENGTGFFIQIVLYGGAGTVSFYSNFGYGALKTTTTLSGNGWLSWEDDYLKYDDGKYLPPRYFKPELAWSNRSTYYQAWVMAMGDPHFVPIYADDPNTTSNQMYDRIMRVLNAVEYYDYFGFSCIMEHHDTNHNLRNTLKLTILFKKEGNIWKVRIPMVAYLNTTCHNYDDAGSTTSHGVEAWVYSVQTAYYAWSISTSSWTSLSFSTTGYTWRTGYRGTRIRGLIGSDTIYAYTRWLKRCSTYSGITPSNYKHARYYTHPWLNHYFDEWGDVDLPAGYFFGEEVEVWYSETDQYEATPPVAPLYTDTSWIDIFF